MKDGQDPVLLDNQWNLRYKKLTCGCRQVVRQQLPKLLFVGSSPITRFFVLIGGEPFQETVEAGADVEGGVMLRKNPGWGGE